METAADFARSSRRRSLASRRNQEKNSCSLLGVSHAPLIEELQSKPAQQLLNFLSTIFLSRFQYCCHSEAPALARGICFSLASLPKKQIPPPPRSEFGMTVAECVR